MGDVEARVPHDFEPPVYTVLEQFLDGGTGERVTRVLFEGEEVPQEFRIHIDEREALLDGYMLWKENNQP